jgi:hypothetical protein
MPDSAVHALSPTAFERLAREVPGLPAIVGRLAARARARIGADDNATLERSDLDAAGPLFDWLEDWGRTAMRCGEEFLDVKSDAQTLSSAVWAFSNFELHHRKLFWVDESLAWMLSETRLDIEGRALRLPFPSFALVFSDPAAIALAQAVRDADGLDPSRSVRSITVHVTRLDGEGALGLGVSLCFFLDLSEGWPYLLSRDLDVREGDRLDAVLESHLPDVDPVTLDPVFLRPEMRALVHLVVNAILFITSADEPWRVLAPPGGSSRGRLTGGNERKSRRAARLRRQYSSESVFHLPGRIPIARVRELRAARAHGGGEMYARFMVRGHWRRAAPDWADQRARWIEPYWKGPELSAVLEREYVLKDR